MTMPSPSTIIYTHGGGRLGNQIIRFAHWIAWAQAHAGQVEMLNLAFWPFAQYFAIWREHPGCVFPIRPAKADRLACFYRSLPQWLRARNESRYWLQRTVHTAGGWSPGSQAIALNDASGESIDLDGPEFFQRVEKRRVTTCSGWRIASWRLVEEQQATLREFFRPASEFVQRPAEFIAALRQRHDVVIGVHIRQSDYRAWDEGRFYFSSAQYATWIRQLLDLHGSRRVAIVLASEDKQDPTLFAGLPVHFATGGLKSGGHWFEDWVELSLCDFVVSAPSTFSATAAFLGGVPLWPVVAADQVMAFDQLIADGMIGASRHPVFSRSVK